ncbi:hypothetical protein R1sor_024513 [Riccia sorocarpa]|uniref:Uncharacterized protein n=1 Tax=Riccia sorocarpa TaxID=122646 RepID=A0ABD3GQP9_9MARC
MAAPRSISEVNELIVWEYCRLRRRGLAVTVTQFSTNDQLHCVYRACAFRRGENGERVCWKSVERLTGYSWMKRFSLDADHVCGEHGWEWAWVFHIKLRDASVADVPLMQLPKYTASQIDTHIVGAAARAIRAMQECHLKVDSSIGQFNHICEQISSVQAEIEEVKSVMDYTAQAVEDILSLIESQG